MKKPDYNMRFEEAQQVIRDSNASSVAWLVAAAVLAEDERSSFEDLLACLKRKGSIAVHGAAGLYKKTRRRKRRLAWKLDPDEWRNYLQTRGLI